MEWRSSSGRRLQPRHTGKTGKGAYGGASAEERGEESSGAWSRLGGIVGSWGGEARVLARRCFYLMRA